MPDRPRVAVVSNTLTPYRLHFHRRAVREVPEVELWSLFTHEDHASPWALPPAPEINPVYFGPGEPASQQGRARFAWHEWRKGGRVVRWLRGHHARAAVVAGYNDPGRLRVLRWCHRAGVPAFLFGDSNVRGDRAAGWTGRLKRLVLPRVLGWCAGVLACGSLGQEYFARYGVPRDRMFLTPYEPDYDLIGRVTPADVSAARRRFGLDPARRYLLFSGRLVTDKRVDLLLDAFAAVAPDRPAWDLAVLGGGPLAEALRGRVPDGLRDRVRWLGFLGDPAAVGAVYRAAAVLALPSDYEPWAVVVNEAVAAGLALVASDVVGAAAELVRPGVNGFVFPRGDLAALTRCLREVTDPGRCDALRAGAAAVLADWRRRADPVAGLRAALRAAGVLG
jgi:glycosyltransferase involved in cell wall biosynthesis